MSDTKTRAPKDIAILSGPTEDGQGAKVLRIREGDVSAGEIRPVREGEPIHRSELVRLHPLDPGQRVCAVEVLHSAGDSSRAGAADGEAKKSQAAQPEQRKTGSAGPARVSNAKYRQNWSTIFEGDAAKKRDADWSLN